MAPLEKGAEMLLLATTFNHKALHDEIFGYAYPRKISDIINREAFFGLNGKLELIRPWFSSIQAEALEALGLTNIDRLPYEVFGLGVVMEVLYSESTVVTPDFRIKDALELTVKRSYSADASLMEKAHNHLECYGLVKNEYDTLSRMVANYTYNHVRRVAVNRFSVGIEFNDEDERLVAFGMMERAHAKKKETEFIPPKQQSLECASIVPWARDIDKFIPKYYGRFQMSSR